jgi:hypothetical protein
MTNRTYFIDRLSGFANQFALAIATTELDAENYIAKGYERITRKTAARLAAKSYISAIDRDYRIYEIDHGRYEPGYWSPSFAALCRAGGEIDPRDIHNVQHA